MDTLTSEQRRKTMQAVNTKNTKPELNLRKALFKRGYRFRLHKRCLPGSPDIVFPGKKKVVFVHGCFWHAHDCNRGTFPKSHEDFWREKLENNRRRDERNREELTKLGWRVFTVWECETKNLEAALLQVQAFLDAD